MKHKGYNNVTSSNGNSVAQKLKYNGVEYEESFELNLYEMDVRSYDPTIARFNGIDPVTHFSQGSSVAFDNNPIYWADPSGANSESKFAWAKAWYINASGQEEEEEKETAVQKKFRELATKYTVAADNASGMHLSTPANDQDVDAYQLFYQWVMGAGPSVRNFDENSTMGKQMLEAPEVLKAIRIAIAKAEKGNFEGEGFRRRLKKENALAYIKDFYNDVNGRNPARGFHGSFRGKINVNVVYDGKGTRFYNLSIIMRDNMSAISGTRASPLAGGYAPNPAAIYPISNPYGPRGQFRTIKVNYRMNISVHDGNIIKK